MTKDEKTVINGKLTRINKRLDEFEDFVTDEMSSIHNKINFITTIEGFMALEEIWEKYWTGKGYKVIK